VIFAASPPSSSLTSTRPAKPYGPSECMIGFGKESGGSGTIHDANPQVRWLGVTVMKSCRKFYCGLARRYGQCSKQGSGVVLGCSTQGACRHRSGPDHRQGGLCQESQKCPVARLHY
jgi:hypothetical protein